MNIEHISVSRKLYFDTCPQAYKYKYHLGIKPDIPEPFHFTYGKMVHKVAEEYVSRSGQTTIENLLKEVFEGSILVDNKPFPKLPLDYQFRLPNHIRSLKKLIDSVGHEGITEYEFNYDLDPPNGKIIKGFIDRIIIKNDKCFIIDYKTTKTGPWRKDLSTITADLQLKCYAKIVQKKLSFKPQDIRAALYYLEDGQMVGVKFSAEDLDQAEKIMLDSYNRIFKADPDKVLGIVGEHCKRCDYRGICPFYSSGRGM